MGRIAICDVCGMEADVSLDPNKSKIRWCSECCGHVPHVFRTEKTFSDLSREEQTALILSVTIGT